MRALLFPTLALLFASRVSTGEANLPYRPETRLAAHAASAAGYAPKAAVLVRDDFAALSPERVRALSEDQRRRLGTYFDATLEWIETGNPRRFQRTPFKPLVESEFNEIWDFIERENDEILYGQESIQAILETTVLLDELAPELRRQHQRERIGALLAKLILTLSPTPELRWLSGPLFGTRLAKVLTRTGDPKLKEELREYLKYAAEKSTLEETPEFTRILHRWRNRLRSSDAPMGHCPQWARLKAGGRR